MSLPKDTFVQLTFSIAKTPFSVSIVIEGCATPWLLSVSSNAFVINHVVVHKGELTAWSTWISTMSCMAICDKKGILRPWLEWINPGIPFVWFSFLNVFHTAQSTMGVFLKWDVYQILKVALVGFNLFTFVLLLFCSGGSLSIVFHKQFCEVMRIGQIESTGALSMRVLFFSLLIVTISLSSSKMS